MAKQRKLMCPYCGALLDMRIEAFTCNASVAGPYIRGTIRLKCSKHECSYAHTILGHSKNLGTISAIEQATAKLVKEIPRYGPWDKLLFQEKDKKKFRRGE